MREKLKKIMWALVALFLAAGMVRPVYAAEIELEPYYCPIDYPGYPRIQAQGPVGVCWIFGMSGLVEVNYWKQTGQKIDVSEAQILSFLYGESGDKLGGLAGDMNDYPHGDKWDSLQKGGHTISAARSLANWRGAVLEEQAPYENIYDNVLNKTLDPSLAYESNVLHVENIFRVDIKNDPRTVKEMVKQYGGVTLNYGECSNCYWWERKSYYNPTYSVNGRHKVLIVGWDDNFKKENFKVQPEGDGAWLVRDTRRIGHFWVSYYDKSMEAGGTSVTVAPSNNYDYNYQYDGGLEDYTAGYSTELKVANVFTTKGNEGGQEALRAVSFAMTVTSSKNIDPKYEIKIYKNPETSNPESGELCSEATTKGTMPYIGYLTVPLAKEVILNQGDRFSVVVTLISEEELYKISAVTDISTYEAAVKVEEGQSFIWEKEAWKDFGKDKNRNLRIKAFTDKYNGTVSANSLTVDATEKDTEIGQQFTLKSTVEPENVSSEITWSSSDPSVAAVDHKGNVTAMGMGTAVITARVADKEASCTVKVTGRIEVEGSTGMVRLEDSGEEIQTGLTGPMEEIIYKAQEGYCFPEDYVLMLPLQNAFNKGMSMGQRGGLEVIRVSHDEIRVQGSPMANVAIYLIPASEAVEVTGINLNKASLNLEVGKTEALTPNILPANGSNRNVTWTSSEPSIATVEGGAVTALAEGKTTITATTEEGGYQATCEVTVIAASVPVVPVVSVTEVKLDQESLSLMEGETATLKETVTPADATNKAVTWSTDKETVATVEEGVVTAVAEGTATITVTTEDGSYRATCEVTVSKASESTVTVTAVVVTPDAASVMTGGTKQFTAKVEGTNSPSRSVDWTVEGKSSQNTVISREGLLTVGSDETAAILTVKASSTVDITKSGTAVVTITTQEKPVDPPVDIPVDSPEEKEIGLRVRLADSTEEYVYTGSPIEPKIIVTNNGEELTPGVDYTVKYTNNVKASEEAKTNKKPRITITGKGSLKGTTFTTFDIRARSLSEVSAGNTFAVRNSKAVPSLYYHDLKLKAGRDYQSEDLSTKFTETGVRTITLTGVGNFTGKRMLDIEVIEKEELGRFTVSFDTDDVDLVYDGTPKQVAPVVKDRESEAVLTEGEDYLVTYSKNVTDAGKVKMTVTGMGYYTGTATRTYTIRPVQASAESLTVSGVDPDGYEYTPSGVTFGQDLTVTYETADGRSSVLTEGEDYRITYSNNKKIGENAKYKLSFIGNYKGTGAISQNFAIHAARLDNTTEGLKISVPDKVYSGKAGTYVSKPYVTINGATLKASDYVVEYYCDENLTRQIKGKQNLIQLEEGQEAAEVWVKLTGKANGNYSPADEEAYAVATYQVWNQGEAIDLSKASVSFKGADGRSLTKMEYVGRELEPAVEVKIKIKSGKKWEWKIVDSSLYQVTYVNNVNRGTATAVITAVGDGYVGSKAATFKIVTMNLAGLKDFWNNLFV